MRYMIIIAVLVSLTGCVEFDLSSLPLNENNLTEVGDLIKTASETKEAIYYDAVKSRDKQYAKMYATQGFKLEWSMNKQTINGVDVYIPMPEVSYKAPPVFQQPLPSGPSVHPVWNTINHGVDWLGRITLGWFVYDGAKTIWQRSAPQYNGPYSYQSYNPSTSTSSTQILP